MYSTHYLQEFETLEATVAIMEQGSIVVSGTVQDLISAHGGSVVAMTFDGSPPSHLRGYTSTVSGCVIRLNAEDPGMAIADILGQLGPDSAPVQGIDIIRPSLETAYLTLTGNRFVNEEAVNVVAA